MLSFVHRCSRAGSQRDVKQSFRLLHRDTLAKLTKPIENDQDLEGAGCLTELCSVLDDDKFPIRCDVEISHSSATATEDAIDGNWYRITECETRLRRNFYTHEPA